MLFVRRRNSERDDGPLASASCAEARKMKSLTLYSCLGPQVSLEGLLCCLSSSSHSTAIPFFVSYTTGSCSAAGTHIVLYCIYTFISILRFLQYTPIRSSSSERDPERSETYIIHV